MSHKHTMIPPEIRKKYIDSKPREKIFQRKFSIPVGNKRFDIYLWFPTTLSRNHPKKNEILMSHKQIQEKILRILKKVYLWLHVVCSYLPKTHTCSNLVEIYIFHTEQCTLNTESLKVHKTSASMLVDKSNTDCSVIQKCCLPFLTGANEEPANEAGISDAAS